MEKTDAASRPCRRVGTFTFGMVLVVSGLAMLVSMFFPQLEFTWLLQLSPLALISLGGDSAGRPGQRTGEIRLGGDAAVLPHCVRFPGAVCRRLVAGPLP